MPPKKRKPAKKVAPIKPVLPTQVECAYLTCSCLKFCKRETAS